MASRSSASPKNSSSVSLRAWTQVPVWREGAPCVAYIKGSFTGSLTHPKIGEAGRAFLASLLSQLSDAQLRDLFQTARVDRRTGGKDETPSAVEEWVAAFKLKRAQILDQTCPL